MPRRREREIKTLAALRGDTRGLAIGVIGFVAILIISALLYTMFAPAADSIFSMTTNQTSSAQAGDAIDRRRQIMDGMPFYLLFLGMVFFIARSVFESRRP